MHSGEPLTIGRRRWIFRTTPLPMRVNGEPSDSLIDFQDGSVLVSTADGAALAVQAAARAVAHIARCGKAVANG